MLSNILLILHRIKISHHLWVISYDSLIMSLLARRVGASAEQCFDCSIKWHLVEPFLKAFLIALAWSKNRRDCDWFAEPRKLRCLKKTQIFSRKPKIYCFQRVPRKNWILMWWKLWPNIISSSLSKHLSGQTLFHSGSFWSCPIIVRYLTTNCLRNICPNSPDILVWWTWMGPIALKRHARNLRTQRIRVIFPRVTLVMTFDMGQLGQNRGQTIKNQSLNTFVYIQISTNIG